MITKSFLLFSILAFLIRIGFIIYGEWQDKNLTVKYTDIDYIVFTDASRFVTKGESPYNRATYRYTPLLAYILTPNIYLNQLFGKIIFSISDILVAYILFSISKLRSFNLKTATILISSLWLFNPIIINISTRGNAESIVCLLVVLTIYLLLSQLVFLGSIIFALAVHFKIFPILYALPFLLMMDDNYSKKPANKDSNNRNDPKNSETKKSKNFFMSILSFFNRNRLEFGFVSAITFLGLTALFYYIYGFHFLYEAYLYHVVRHDNRHNFSVYFYQLYLMSGSQAPQETDSSPILAILAFLPQLVLLGVFSIKFSKDTIFACFLNTFTFVMFNKVCTVQYFAWYFALIPLILSDSSLKISRGLFSLLIWYASQLLWLYFAYQLEFLGNNTFFFVWFAGILFFFANLWVLIEFLISHKDTVLFLNGKIKKQKED
ncbi:pig-m mannosyltransferase [Anaeramoeba ignava]|uniref:GPI mannosyltransferase 1 n=1 Tax=Anaeramoeba ignava TaxID=1746090 RepID=A0A9Q0LDQ3_ANAIG|nr:pig-m mannosyltransferase [Anaeramoeba ignava]